MMLHVACLPFPSPQGTQAALDSMLRASVAEGRRVHLLAYSHGARRFDAPYEVHRLPDFPKVRSLRSGPSWGKIALDVRCVARIRALVARLKPSAIVAHHIEAAVATIAARVGPVYYIAHTKLDRELPVYFPRVPETPIAAMARAVERWACNRAERVAAIAPSLSSLLGDDVMYLPVPWSTLVPGPHRDEARAALGLRSGAPIGVYAGNLDRYQGWEHLLDGLAHLKATHPAARLLIATESDATGARTEAARRALEESVDFRGLDGERARTLIHAAADFAWVPRRTDGGLPIKMLDAFSRGVPVIAMDRAAAGLPVRRACAMVPNDDPIALASAAANLLARPGRAGALRTNGFDYLTTHHSRRAFQDALDRMIGRPAAESSRAMLTAPHQPTAPALRAR